MSVVTFLLLLVIAAIASGVQTLICSPWVTKVFICRFVAYALLLPALLPRLLGG